MIDSHARPVTSRLLAPLAAACPLSATAVTALGLVIGLASAASAAASLWLVAVILWLLNRLLDGLDGAVARRADRQSDLGGYLDMLADVIVYASVPLGVALGRGDRSVWMAAGILVATFYVNIVSWLYLSALLEKREQGVQTTGERTAVTMPRGLVEGTETIVFFSLFLILPSRAAEIMVAMSIAVVVSIGMQVRAATGLLRPSRKRVVQ